MAWNSSELALLRMRNSKSSNFSRETLLICYLMLLKWLGMAETKSAMRKPVFTKVDQLRPGTSGHNLTVKVVSANMVVQKGRPDGPQVRQMRIAECLIGDETGTILFTARNDQGMAFQCGLFMVYHIGFVCSFSSSCDHFENHCQ